MRNATLYDGWEPSRPEMNGRSYLVHLSPIGIGTAAVESLTGYIARLAAAHAAIKNPRPKAKAHAKGKKKKR